MARNKKTPRKLNVLAPMPFRAWKLHRASPRKAILNLIRCYQKAIKCYIRKTPFMRSVRQVAHKFKTDLRFKSAATRILHQVSETYLVGLLEETNKLATFLAASS